MKTPPGNGRRFLVRSRASAQSKLFGAVSLSHSAFVALYGPIIAMPNGPKGDCYTAQLFGKYIEINIIMPSRSTKKIEDKEFTRSSDPFFPCFSHSE
jgi:hypothetical protein